MDRFDFMVLLCGVAFIGLIIGGAMAADEYACGSRADMMKLEHSWGPLQGCMVDAGDRWAPIEYIRIVDGKISIQAGE